MSHAGSELAQALTALARPLRFAAQDNFANLDRVRDLAALMEREHTPSELWTFGPQR